MANRTVKVDMPGTPHGAELEIPGIGLVKNGESREVTDEQVAAFEDLGYTFPSSGTLNVPIKADTSKKVTKTTDQPKGGEGT